VATSGHGDEIRDSLPDDLNITAFSGAYEFPDNSRRRSPLVNGGWIAAALLLGLVSLFSITSGWRMSIDEKQALVLATRAVGFAVGHASAQQVWHGVRSRPTWRVFCYSAEEPPLRRGLVLVDAVNGSVLEKLTEANPDGAKPTE